MQYGPIKVRRTAPHNKYYRSMKGQQRKLLRQIPDAGRYVAPQHLILVYTHSWLIHAASKRDVLSGCVCVRKYVLQIVLGAIFGCVYDKGASLIYILGCFRRSIEANWCVVGPTGHFYRTSVNKWSGTLMPVVFSWEMHRMCKQTSSLLLCVVHHPSTGYTLYTRMGIYIYIYTASWCEWRRENSRC